MVWRYENGLYICGMELLAAAGWFIYSVVELR